MVSFFSRYPPDFCFASARGIREKKMVNDVMSTHFTIDAHGKDRVCKMGKVEVVQTKS